MFVSQELSLHGKAMLTLLKNLCLSRRLFWANSVSDTARSFTEQESYGLTGSWAKFWLLLRQMEDLVLVLIF